MARPTILHYTHHSRGLGHLVRSLAVAEALSRRFNVVLASGGPVPPHLPWPDAVELVQLPAIGEGSDGRLDSLDPSLTLEQAWERRQTRLLELHRALRPAAIVIELFPFGRARFARELLPLLDAARRDPRPATVVSSVRDLLVTAKSDQQGHDDLAAERLRRYFDAVIVHADERFVRLDDTFRPTTSLNLPVFYSGFVAASAQRPVRKPRRPAEVLVSAGGGRDGGPVLQAAARAHELVLGARGFRTRLITGPFFPPSEVPALEEAAARAGAGLTIEPFVPDLASELAGAAVSVSRCGYNTTLDLLRSGVPSVVVPYDGGRETEQAERARRLAELGAVRLLPSAELSPAALAEAILRAAVAPPPRLALDLSGAANTAALVAGLIEADAARRRAA